MPAPHTRKTPILLGLGLALLLASCAGAPSAPPSPGPSVEAAKAPVAKERIVLVRTPVLLKESVFYPDGLLDEYSSYAYDASKTLLLEKASFDPARTEPRERTLGEYDADKRLVLEQVYDAEGVLRQRRQYTYDQRGLLAAERLLDATGLLQSSSSYSYDAQGRRSEWKALDGAGLLKASTRYSYDGSGRPALVELLDAAGRVTGSFRYEYSGTGPVEKKSFHGPDGSLQRFELSEYREGLLRRYELRRADGSLVESRDYAYGPLGELLSSSTMDGTGRLRERRSYEYLVREDQKTEIYYE